MSGDVITTFPADALEDLRVDTLVWRMEQDKCIGVPGARYDETTLVFLERYFLIIGERILQGHEDVLTCINDPTSAGKRLMLYKKPVSPRTVELLRSKGLTSRSLWLSKFEFDRSQGLNSLSLRS